jgi:uncharacterized protein YcgL (UPF0745 family)
MYLYVDREAGMQHVPEALLRRFGEPQEVMTLALGAERRLARANAAEVLARIESEGYYLQLPPSAVKPGDGGAGGG